jgi:hypothetical protein
MAVRLSALRASSPPFTPPGIFPRLSRTQDHNAAARIMSIKKSNDNRTRDPPACGIVSQTTTLPRGLADLNGKEINFKTLNYYLCIRALWKCCWVTGWIRSFDSKRRKSLPRRRFSVRCNENVKGLTTSQLHGYLINQITSVISET